MKNRKLPEKTKKRLTKFIRSQQTLDSTFSSQNTNFERLVQARYNTAIWKQTTELMKDQQKFSFVGYQNNKQPEYNSTRTLPYQSVSMSKCEQEKIDRFYNSKSPQNNSKQGVWDRFMEKTDPGEIKPRSNSQRRFQESANAWRTIFPDLQAPESAINILRQNLSVSGQYRKPQHYESTIQKCRPLIQQKLEQGIFPACGWRPKTPTLKARKQHDFQISQVNLPGTVNFQNRKEKICRKKYLKPPDYDFQKDILIFRFSDKIVPLMTKKRSQTPDFLKQSTITGRRPDCVIKPFESQLQGIASIPIDLNEKSRSTSKGQRPNCVGNPFFSQLQGLASTPIQQPLQRKIQTGRRPNEVADPFKSTFVFS